MHCLRVAFRALSGLPLRALTKLTIVNRSFNVKAFLAILRPLSIRHRSLPEETLPLLPCFMRRIVPPPLPCRINESKVVTKIARGAVTHGFTLGLTALIGGRWIMEYTITAAPYIAMTTGTDFPSAHNPADVQLCPAEIASIHGVALRLQRDLH
jgi:hypothetical protein